MLPITAPFQLIPLCTPRADFDAIVHETGNPKPRSTTIHTTDHVPFLRASESALTTVLLGSSMVARFSTTGRSTQLASSPNVFNAGVGGETIANVLYRVEMGLLHHLQVRDVKPLVIVLQCGGNDMRKNRVLRDQHEMQAFYVLLVALVRECPQAWVLVAELFEKAGIPSEVVRKSNDRLKMVMQIVNEQLNEVGRPPALVWVNAPKVEKGDYEPDGEHLNPSGYKKWDAVLRPAVQRFLPE